MKQKYYIIGLLLKIYFGNLCFSILCDRAILWLITRNMEKSPCDSAWMGILFIWNIFAILFLSIGASTLFLNCFEGIRHDRLYSFLSFFLVPVLMILFEVMGRLLRGQNISQITTVLCPVAISFMLCLSISYILFLYKLKKE